MTAEEIDLRIESYWTSLKYGTDDQRKRALRLFAESIDRAGFERGKIAGVKLATETIRENSGHLPALLGAR